MTQTLDISLLACPTLTEAARLLGVSASTLSRRDDVVVERMGERDKRIPAGEVMRLAVVYRKRSSGEVAADLIARARESSPQHAEHVQEEVERALPAELYEQVRRVYRTAATVAEMPTADALLDPAGRALAHNRRPLSA